jgi:hypothetical protein
VGAKMRRCIAGLVNGALLRALGRWTDEFTQRREVLQRMHHASVRMLNRQVAMGVSKWRRCTARRADMLKAKLALQRLQSRHASRGWNAWSSFATERAAKLARLRRGVTHMRHRKLAPRWYLWVELAAAHAEHRRKVARAEAPLAVSWLESFGWSKPAVAKGLAGLVYREMRRGWLAWREAHKRCVDALTKLRQAIGRGRNAEVTRVWMGWREVHEAQKETLEQIRHTMAHMLKRELASGFRTWRQMITKSSHETIVKGRVMSFWLNGSLARGWSLWVRLCVARREAIESTRRCIARALNNSLSRGFNRWADGIRQRAQLLEALRRGAAPMLNRQLWGGLRKWRRTVRSPDLGKTEASIRRLSKRALSRGWNAWVGLVAERSASLQAMRKGVARMLQLQLARGLAAWRRNTCRKIDSRTVSLRNAALSAGHARLISCARAFDAWQLEYAELWASRHLAVHPLHSPRRPGTPRRKLVWTPRAVYTDLMDRQSALPERERMRPGREPVIATSTPWSPEPVKLKAWTRRQVQGRRQRRQLVVV